MYEGQLRHLLLLAPLLAAAGLAFRACGPPGGGFGGYSTEFWFWLSIATPVVHQIYVWFCWRIELHHRGLSRLLGAAGFRIYAFGFGILIVGRFVTLALLAVADRNSLADLRTPLQVAGWLVAVPVVYLFYSVARYFGYSRGVGIDHFDPSYRDRPLVRKGIFRFTRNAMYVFGLLAAWLPGLFAASKAALVGAAFNHAYIWVHYACTERPDMRRIYGTGNDGERIRNSNKLKKATGD